MVLEPAQRRAYQGFLIWNGGYTLFFTLIATVNLVYQFQVAHLTPLQLVLVGTTLEIVCFLSQAPTGVIADVSSRRWAIIIGTLLVGLGFTIEGLFPHFAAILLAQVIWGLGATLHDGADSAWLASEVGEDHLEHIFARSGQIGQVLCVIGIPLSVALASIRLNLPVVLGGVLLMILALTLPLLLTEHAFTPPPRAERSPWQMLGQTLRLGLREVRVSQTLCLLLGIELCFGLASEGWDRLWQPYLLTAFTFPHVEHVQPVVWIGVAEIGSALLGIIAAQILVSRLQHATKAQRIGLLLALMGMRIVGIGIFALAGNLWLALAAFWVIDLTRTVNRPLYDARFVRSVTPGVRATVLSFRGQVNAFGQIAGGPGLGVIGNRSLRAALGTVGVLLTPILALLIGVRRVERQAPIPASISADGEEIG